MIVGDDPMPSKVRAVNYWTVASDSVHALKYLISVWKLAFSLEPSIVDGEGGFERMGIWNRKWYKQSLLQATSVPIWAGASCCVGGLRSADRGATSTR